MSSEATLSYSHGASARPLLGETIGANLRRVAAAFPDAEVLVDVPTGRRWTYAAFDAETDTLARGLIAAGLAAGDRVGIWAPNCAEWVLVQYATAKAGIILVNINPAYRSHELGFVVRQSGVRVLVSAERFKTSDYRAMIDELRPDLPGLEEVIFLGTSAWDELFSAGQAAATAPTAPSPTCWLSARPACRSTSRSTSSTRAGRRGSRRARPCRTTTSSTTPCSSGTAAATPSGTGSASRCRSTTASGWCSATWPAPPMARAS